MLDVQVADFGLSKVLSHTQTHVSTDSYGELALSRPPAVHIALVAGIKGPACSCSPRNSGMPARGHSAVSSKR